MIRQLLLLTALAAAGCERWEAPQSPENQLIPAKVEEVALPGGGNLLFVTNPRPRHRGRYQDANFHGGQLRLQNGCLLLEDALIVWPRGTRLDLSRPGRIAVVDEGRAAIVGGYLSPTGRVIPGRIDNPRLGSCAGRPVFLVNDYRPLSPEQWAEYQGPPRTTPPRPPAPGPRGEPSELPSPSPYSTVPRPGVTGRFVVAEINGRPPPPSAEPITVSLGPDALSARSGCLDFRWPYVPPPAPPSAGAQPPALVAVCARTMSSWERAFQLAIGEATEVTPGPNGAVTYSGPVDWVVLRPAPPGR